jgi:hypothetical protein
VQPLARVHGAHGLHHDPGRQQVQHHHGLGRGDRGELGAGAEPDHRALDGHRVAAGAHAAGPQGAAGAADGIAAPQALQPLPRPGAAAGGLHPAVREVAVVGYPDERLGERVCACVAPHPGSELSLAEIVAFLDAKGLSKHKLPEHYLEIDAIPLSDVGKPLKSKLRELLGG